MTGVVVQGVAKAIDLILRGDPELVSIVFLTLIISLSATLLSASWSLPLSMVIGLRRFRGRSLVKSVNNALMGMPTVALGTILYLLLSRNGPLGSMHILYTPLAIVIGEAILVTPITTSFTIRALESVDSQIMDLSKSLGASQVEAELSVLREAKQGVALAVIASYGRAVAELGVALMVGGNIPGSTRVLTTAIAIGIGRGDLALGIALTIILLAIVGGVTLVINQLSRRE